MPRLLACRSCGNPIDVPDEGGNVTCAECSATRTWGARPETRSTVLPKPERTPGETDRQYEERRLGYLRKQADQGVDNSPYATFDAPSGLEHLELAYDDPTLPGLLTEAFRRAIERCEESHGAMDAERNLFWIAGKYKNSLVLSGGDRRPGYAWLQTCREMIRDPGLQHIIACNLADQARSEDQDFDRARALLDSADATPWQLPLDSQYRTSAGMLALVTDDLDGALRLVGERNDAVPFTDACIYQACFIRTAALERAGRSDEAEKAFSFNVGILPHELIVDWLDGSEALAPVAQVFERLQGGDDDDDDDEAEDPFEDSAPARLSPPPPPVPASITPRSSSREVSRESGSGGRIFLLMAIPAAMVAIGLLVWLLVR